MPAAVLGTTALPPSVAPVTHNIWNWTEARYLLFLREEKDAGK